MRVPALALALLALIPAQARAEGFGVRDLATMAPEISAALGTGFSNKSEPQRLTLICPKCDAEPIIDLQMGRQTDGTEERVRSGQTTVSRLEKLCQERNPSCRLTGLDVAPAVGWISTYSMGATFASTVVILRGGDLDYTLPCVEARGRPQQRRKGRGSHTAQADRELNASRRR